MPITLAVSLTLPLMAIRALTVQGSYVGNPKELRELVKLAQEGTYNGTVFHRAVKLGIIQGGDPLSRDPGKRALYGTGGLAYGEAKSSTSVSQTLVGFFGVTPNFASSASVSGTRPVANGDPFTGVNPPVVASTV